MTRRTLWIDALAKEKEFEAEDGTHLVKRSEYRRWGHVAKPLEHAGCPSCGTALFDRLTMIFKVRQDQSLELVEYHLNSSPSLEEPQSPES